MIASIPSIPSVITHCAELDQFVERVQDAEWIAVDTEFMRDSTYYAKLCLVQIASADCSACIDVLKLDDHSRLLELLQSPQQIKIFHSARQDIEVLHSEYDLIPQPVFDSQIAASILGLDEQISYAELVSQILDVHLAKTESRTDWSRRPLTSAQINYALDDVRHLGPLYLHLKKQLEDNQRVHWLDEECTGLCNKQQYVVAPEHAWQQVKGVGRLAPEILPITQALAAWRETTAIEKNLPRRWILSDQSILQLAEDKPHSEAQVTMSLRKDSSKSLRYSKVISTLLEQAYKNTHPLHFVDRRLSREQQDLVKRMMKVSRKRSELIGTSASLLANRKSIVSLVLGLESKIMQGWRRQEIGQDLMNMLN